MSSAMSGPPTPQVDVIPPRVARMQNLLLGGKDHMPADWAVIEQLHPFIPVAQQAARENRVFGGRAVEYMTQTGIRQIINIGIGLATPRYEDEAIGAQCADICVVHVDNDPLVLAYARALIPRTPNTHVLEADMRRPREILDAKPVRALIDFSEPVGVLLVAMLHFVTVEDDPARIVQELMAPLAAGSALAISHATTSGPDPTMLAKAVRAFDATPTPLIPRSPEQIAGLFSGLDVIDPGVVDLPDWRSWPGDWPGDPDCGIEPSHCLRGGVAVKPHAGGPHE